MSCPITPLPSSLHLAGHQAFPRNRLQKQNWPQGRRRRREAGEEQVRLPMDSEVEPHHSPGPASGQRVRAPGGLPSPSALGRREGAAAAREQAWEAAKVLPSESLFSF